MSMRSFGLIIFLLCVKKATTEDVPHDLGFERTDDFLFWDVSNNVTPAVKEEEEDDKGDISDALYITDGRLDTEAYLLNLRNLTKPTRHDHKDVVQSVPGQAQQLNRPDANVAVGPVIKRTRLIRSKQPKSRSKVHVVAYIVQDTWGPILTV
eukprot:Lankesteria_metandrocarpae@DN4548_c0_g1_i4.p2